MDESQCVLDAQSNLSDWLVYQAQIHPNTIDLGLARVTQLLNALDWEQKKIPFPVITVGGTNGKGSGVAFLEGIFLAAGYHTGAYTSPHLWRYNERVRLDGREVTDSELCHAFTQIEAKRDNVPLTYFEYGTLAALLLFRKASPDIVILEVGLGGRLDATNAIDSDIAVIMTVDLDHQDWLGPDRESIGFEKAGLFRSGRPAICGDFDPPKSLIHQSIGTRFYQAGKDFNWRLSSKTKNNQCWDWFGPDKVRKGLPTPRLLGRHQYQNAATILMAIDCLSDRLPVSDAAIHQALTRVTLPGRFQIIPGPVTHILEVAHNPQAAAALADTLKMNPTGHGTGRTFAVVGMLKDKDIKGVLSVLINVVEAWYPATLSVPRGASAHDLAELLIELGGLMPNGLHETVQDALAAARNIAISGDRIVIFGSFYTAGVVGFRI